MRALNLTDHKKRDSHIAFEPKSPLSQVGFVLEHGERAMSVKIIKNTFNTHYPTLLEKAGGEPNTVAEMLIAGDPEVDFNYMGKISSRTKTVYLDENNKIAYNLNFKERVLSPDGELKEERELERKASNITTDYPLRWTGKFMPIKKAVGMFVFSKAYQLRHINGLTFDFLYEIAKELDEKQALMLLGAGPSGKEPLRFSRGGPPYRAFLHGKVKDNAYRLSLHLTNLELKDFQ